MGRKRVISAIQQNNKYESSFYCRNTALPMICTPKYLHEIFRIQLSCTTPREHRAENSYIEMTKESNFTFSMSAPLPSYHSSVPGKNTPAFDFPFRK